MLCHLPIHLDIRRHLNVSVAHIYWPCRFSSTLRKLNRRSRLICLCLVLNRSSISLNNMRLVPLLLVDKQGDREIRFHHKGKYSCRLSALLLMSLGWSSQAFYLAFLSHLLYDLRSRKQNYWIQVVDQSIFWNEVNIVNEQAYFPYEQLNNPRMARQLYIVHEVFSFFKHSFLDYFHVQQGLHKLNNCP